MTERIITDSNGRKYITTEPFKPDYNTEAVLVEEMQRMAKRIAELETEQDCVGWFGYDTGLRLWFEANKGDDGAIPLYKDPKPCPTCEALARTVMLDQTSHDQFRPDWDAMAVMVEEQQRMAAELKAANKWIKDSEKIIADQTARIVDLQTHIENHVCSQRPWQGLTDEEIESEISDGFARGLDDGNVSNRAVICYVRVIEAALKERNT